MQRRAMVPIQFFFKNDYSPSQRGRLGRRVFYGSTVGTSSAAGRSSGAA